MNSGLTSPTIPGRFQHKLADIHKRFSSEDLTDDDTRNSLMDDIERYDGQIIFFSKINSPEQIDMLATTVELNKSLNKIMCSEDVPLQTDKKNIKMRLKVETSNKKEMTFDNVSVKKFKDIAFALASKKISLTKIIEVKIIQDFLYESPKEIFDQNNSVSKDIQNFIGTSNSKAFTLANLDELSERLENNGCLSG